MDTSQVRVALTRNDLERVGRFRYLIYVEEQRKQARFVDPSRHWLIEPEDAAPNTFVLYVEHEGEVVATLRAQIGIDPDSELARQTRTDQIGFIEPRRLVHFSRLMLSPNLRGGAAMPTMCFVGFTLGLVKGASIGVIACKPHLMPLFRRFGYLQYAPNYEHPDAGTQVPMGIVAEGPYLRERRAPFAELIAAERPDALFTHPFLEVASRYERLRSFPAATEAPDWRERAMT